MARYFYLVASLPDLEIGQPPELSLDELTFLLKLNLSHREFKEVSTVREYFDIENIRSFWSGYPLNRFGNFDELSLEEALLSGSGLPSYVYAYMQKYESKELRLKHFSSLTVQFFNEGLKAASGFLHSLLQFEREERLVLVALRAKELKRDYLAEFQFEDPEDPLVQELIAQKDAEELTPPDGYQVLCSLYEKLKENPLELQKALLEYRFHKTGELIGLQIFTLDYVLAYVYQWILAQKWVILDREKGKEMINSILQGVA